MARPSKSKKSDLPVSEPRWQQIVSVIVVLIIVAIELLIVLKVVKL